MNFKVDGKSVFAYTAAHELDPGKPALVFVHGAGLDHSLFALQSEQGMVQEIGRAHV